MQHWDLSSTPLDFAEDRLYMYLPKTYNCNPVETSRSTKSN